MSNKELFIHFFVASAPSMYLLSLGVILLGAAVFGAIWHDIRKLGREYMHRRNR